MFKKPKLSIIIVNFNTYQYISECLNSIYRSSKLNQSFEVIVIDNASSDKSVNLIKNNFTKVKLISSQENVGFARANNQGIARSKGKYILLLNPDTILEADTLSFMVSFMESHSDVCVATCKVVLANGSLDDGCHRGFPTPWKAFCYFAGLAKVFPSSKLFNGYHLGYQSLDKVHEIDSCVGAFMMIRRNVGDSIGWLDEDYFWYGEDLDFCYRVKKKGWKVMFVPQVRITHFKGVASGIKAHSKKISTADDKTRKLATIARFEVMRIFYNKHYNQKYPFWLSWIVLQAVRLGEAIELAKIEGTANND